MTIPDSADRLTTILEKVRAIGPTLRERALEAAYDDVERRLSVREVPAAMRSESTNRFVAGAARPSAPRSASARSGAVLSSPHTDSKAPTRSA